MVFNALNDLLGVELNLEKLEKIIMERFESYSSVTCLQYDAEGCFHHRVAYLVLSMIAIDFPQFKYIFFEGESKLLGKSVENKVGIEKEDVLMSLLQYLTHLLQVVKKKIRHFFFDWCDISGLELGVVINKVVIYPTTNN